MRCTGPPLPTASNLASEQASTRTPHTSSCTAFGSCRDEAAAAESSASLASTAGERCSAPLANTTTAVGRCSARASTLSRPLRAARELSARPATAPNSSSRACTEGRACNEGRPRSGSGGALGRWRWWFCRGHRRARAAGRWRGLPWAQPHSTGRRWSCPTPTQATDCWRWQTQPAPSTTAAELLCWGSWLRGCKQQGGHRSTRSGKQS